ncbi:beta-galactosidase [Geminisphaera colitermitum]|uniref:beta-galactosidase n=1 Tax=Geminisphaera colitermitum TaxID=1148786 RepID=UPI000158D413|nr:beta-galactosidase [Geminisphaera colitermitum]
MNLGVQYYRPPFPIKKHWADDLHRIRDSGLDTLQLWVTWAWVESKPGAYRFDDYDRLVKLAADAGLDVILSTIAELQPHWIHDIVPGSEMIDHRGHRVVSSLREESNFGLTPGGCTQNPAVWERMAGFLSAVVSRYQNTPHLAGWDAWNELRWHEQSDGLVCFCPHCLRAFRTWLDFRYGGLDKLNQAWQRRYHSWTEVMPGKTHWRPFTEMMAWQRFITWKANRHGKRRYDLIKSIDPHRAVTVHAGDPTPITSGWSDAYALDRGNDWVFADELDGVGCSSFPKLFGMDDTTFTARVEFVRSAATSGARVPPAASQPLRKKLWLSEVQGGRGSLGFQPTAAVDAASQQRWIWRGFASGADKVLFWCWRDEVFGRESAGFGLTGNDGHAASRLAAMQRTGDIITRHRALLSSYEPDTPSVGVLFSPSSYYLHWSLEGNADTPRKALEGYCHALVNLSIPYTVIEENHLDALTAPPSPTNPLRTLFLPRVIVAGEKLENALATFVRNGGTLVCESECCAFTPEGIYRESSDRFFTRLGLLPGGEVGRRTLDLKQQSILLDGEILPARQWLTPWSGFPTTSPPWATHSDGVLVGEARIPASDNNHHHSHSGRIIHVGTFLGDAYMETRSSAFEHFVARCVGAFEQPIHFPPASSACPTSTAPTDSDARWFVKTGRSGTHRIACIFSPPGTTSARLTVRDGFFGTPKIHELISGCLLSFNAPPPPPPPAERGWKTLDVPLGDWGIAILCA